MPPRYTAAPMVRLIRPVATCVLLVMAALPGVTVACQWACVRGVAGQTEEHAGHHQHHGEASAADMATSGTTLLTSSDQACEHPGDSVTAITVAAMKVLIPAAVHVSCVEIAASSHQIATRATHSPPPPPSGPLPLRI